MLGTTQSQPRQGYRVGGAGGWIEHPHRRKIAD
jgi:hypothetical protein